MGEDLSRERPKKGNKKMRLRGIEPPHAAPEATALSTELQTHLLYNTIFSSINLKKKFIQNLLQFRGER